MRLPYRILIVIAAVAAAATFYAAPTRADRPAKQDSTRRAVARRFRGNTFDTAPVLLKTVQPVYPEKAKKLDVEALILLAITVDEKGKATKAEVVHPDSLPDKPSAYRAELQGEAAKKLDSAKRKELKSLFEKSAIDAALKFSFKPALLKGKPVASNVAVPIKFMQK